MRIRTGFVALLAFFVVGCAAMKPRHEPEARVYVPLGATIRAESTVELKDALFGGRAAIAATGPKDVTIEVRAPFGRLVALVEGGPSGVKISSIDGEESYLYDDPEYPFSFTSEELYWFLTGAPGILPGFESSRDDALGGVTIERKGSMRWLTVRLTDFRDSSGFALPFDIRISGPRGELAIRHSSVVVDVPGR